MEYLVAICTGHPLVPGNIITQLVVVGSVTTGTILKGKRLDLLGIYIAPSQLSRKSLFRCKRYQGQNCQQGNSYK